MARRVRELTNIEIDEVSLVDIPANQHARVAIAKRASEEDTVPEIYDENGQPLDADLLEPGDTVYDADGNAFEVVLEDASEVLVNEQELEPVGKSFADEVRSELSKAFTDIERDEIVAKALGQVDEISKRLEDAERIAKSERDLRLRGEYVAVAKNYNIPTDPEVLGPVLQRMAESMSYEDCSVIHKALTAAGSALFDEIGHVGGADNNDVMSQVDAFLEGDVSKAGESISKAGQIEAFFAANPDAYDAYRAEFNNR